MSTLTDMREALEQVEQDARRFRYLASHGEEAMEIISRAIENAESTIDIPALIRQYTDRFTKVSVFTEGEGKTP